MSDRYRKRPVVVRAWQVGAEPPIPQWYLDACDEGVIFEDDEGLKIKTLEGTSYAIAPGYWIIKGVKGEMWPVRDDVFQETYEPVPEGE